MIRDGDSAVMEYSPDVVNPQISLPDGTRAFPSADSVVDVDEVKRQASKSAVTLPSDPVSAESTDPEDQALEPGVGPERASRDTRPYLTILGVVVGTLLTMVVVALGLWYTKRDVA
jgi:hypothetical protein